MDEMTKDSIDSILRVYNVAYDRELRAEDEMDDPRLRTHTRERMLNDGCFALGQQDGICTVLNLLGYRLVREERYDGYAVDIVKIEEEEGA